MDMAELADSTAIPVRKLRYVFDHRVLPGLATETSGQGIPRTFTAFEAFGIALAARLLDAGLSRRLVAAGLAVACRRLRTGKAHAPLHHAYLASSGQLEIGDGRYLRLSVPGRRGIAEALDTGWLALGKGHTAPDGYTPTVLVSAELGALAETIRGD